MNWRVIAAGLLLAAASAGAAGTNNIAPNPFFVFDNGLHGKNIKTIGSQLDLVKETGFDGLSWRSDTPDHLTQLLAGAKQRGVKVFVVYVNLDIKDGRLVPDAQINDVIVACKNTDTIIWPNITSKQFKPSDPAGDEIAVTGLRELAGLCETNGLRIAVYPHFGLWLQSGGDALRLVKKVNRKNVGLTFNLCHALMEGEEDRIPAMLDEVAPHLFVATISGADSHPAKRAWAQMIQPLDKGSYGTGIVLKKLKTIGFSGPIGLQCYGIGGDARVTLTRSMAAWQKLKKNLED